MKISERSERFRVSQGVSGRLIGFRGSQECFRGCQGGSEGFQRAHGHLRKYQEDSRQFHGISGEFEGSRRAWGYQ